MQKPLLLQEFQDKVQNRTEGETPPRWALLASLTIKPYNEVKIPISSGISRETPIPNKNSLNEANSGQLI